MRTLKSAARFEGIGLHSGKFARVSIEPSFDGTVSFKTASGVFPLTSAVVEEDNRLTGFRLPDGTSVRTAEHLLASIAGMEIDSALIELDGEEVPIGDGSARPFVEAMAAAGICETGEKTAKRALAFPITIDEPESGRFIAAVPSCATRVTYVIDYPGTLVGTQRVTYEINADTFERVISGARTFCLTQELDYLKKHGLALGGSLDNALVFGEDALLNDGGLRFPLEPVTHKVTDLIGDLLLAGPIPIAHYICVCAGHGIHGKLADRLKRLFQAAPAA